MIKSRLPGEVAFGGVAGVGRERLRATFNEDAAAYERRRPGYPARMFDDLTVLTAIGPGCRVLEIGCGTGQLTLPLARLGCSITAVELGADMADVARRKINGLDTVRIVVAAFEDWPLPAERFGLVVAATSFHWLEPTVRMAKSAAALHPGGALAVISTHHVAGGSTAFFAEAQQCYERFDPATPPGLRLTPGADLPYDSAECDQSGYFGPVQFHRYEWDQTYTTTEYLELLSTYSGHRTLPADARHSLFRCIRNLINNNHGGTVTKRYLTELALAHRAG